MSISVFLLLLLEVMTARRAEPGLICRAMHGNEERLTRTEKVVAEIQKTILRARSISNILGNSTQKKPSQ